MAKETKSGKTSDTDIFQILAETAAHEKKRQREKLLSPLGVKEFFSDGSITINKRTCKGLECKLCIKACPTNALFWKTGEVGLTRELCIYCGACVLNCIVDDCIRISRKRPDGRVEVFSSPRGFVTLQHKIDTNKRLEKISEAFPTPEDYVKPQRKLKAHDTKKKNEG
jgi:Fe-S-cluster-containing hydrogenase component 2